MALLNGMYIFVKDEEVNREIDTAAHPVETGIDITDHVKRKPLEITLTGEIVGDSAVDIREQIALMNQKGVVITYVGCNYFKNGQIIDFKTSHENTIWNGCAFELTIREVRFAKSSYDPSAETGETSAKQAAASNRPTQATQQAGVQQRTHDSKSSVVTHTTKNGETVKTITQAYKPQGATTTATQQALIDRHMADIDGNYVPPGTRIPVGVRKGA